MAKSFYTIIEEGKIDIANLGETRTFILPGWLKKASLCLENEQDLLKWAKKYGILHGLLHRGIQQLIIDIRAVARPILKYHKNEHEFNAWIESIKANGEERKWFYNKTHLSYWKKLASYAQTGQSKINEITVKPVAKPGSSKKKEMTPDEMLKALAKEGLSKEEIFAKLESLVQ